MNDDLLDVLTDKLDILEACIFAATQFIQDYEGPLGNIAQGVQLSYRDFRDVFERIDVNAFTENPPEA